jgi:hypothetical protein
MSEPTNTRKTLRRAIASELQMPFFRRFTAGESTTDTGSTSSKIVDASLTQRDGFWNGSWNYMPGTAEQSIIRSFDAGTKAYQLETPLAAAPADTGDAYEIHTLWAASEIHAAINRAIQGASRIFPESVVDATLVMQEGVLEYSLTGLTKSVFQLNKVWIENPGTVLRGTASAGAAATITLESVPTDIDTGWKISIYAGTGKGQVKSYVSNVGNVVTVAAWTTQPDNTSKYALWDASDEIYDWVPLSHIYMDTLEFPDVLRLRGRWPQHFGMRMRLEYLGVPAELSAETDTTIVPKEYVVRMACSILHGQKLNDTKSDRDLHSYETDRYEKMANAYVALNAPHLPGSTIPTYDQAIYIPSDNPLGWGEG